MKKVYLVALGLIGVQAWAGDLMDFRQIPPATTVEESIATFDARAREVLTQYADLDMGVYNNNGVHFAACAKAKLAMGRDVEAVNQALLSPSAIAYSQVGSDFQDLKPFCVRVGDYDFQLRGLIALTYHFWDRPELLWPETRKKIVDVLLTARGNEVRTQVSFAHGLCGTWPETENHVLQTETTRYLTNQLLQRVARDEGRSDPRYDNEANGMNRWMLHHLQHFLQEDFNEYNSHPYQKYTILPIQNLYEFSEDARVKTAAWLVLDYLAARYAVSSNELRRAVPFRRQPPYRDRTDIMKFDGETIRFLLMAGNTQRLAEFKTSFIYEGGVASVVAPAMGTYRVDPYLLEMIVRRTSSYYQRLKHLGTEIYAGSKSFLISAGGVHVPMWGFFTNLNDGWAIATSLMPTGSKIDLVDMIRILGDKRERKRHNLCVAPGFACGMNPVVPESIPSDRRVQQGNWTFVRYDSFYAAVYSQACDTHACKKAGDRFGFFEAAEADGMSFEEFQARVLRQTGSRKFHSDEWNVYYRSSGEVVEFRPYETKRDRWEIRAIGNQPMETDLDHWPLAQGDAIQADRSGRVIINNQLSHKRLVLDFSDAMNPRRYLQ